MFDNTQKAFAHKTTAELKKGALLFKSFNYPLLIKYGPKLAEWAINVGLPVKPLIRKTLFAWFCGGETIDDCEETIRRLYEQKVGTILDYSVEGDNDESSHNATCQEIVDTILKASGNEAVPFSVFKATGLVNSILLEKKGNQSTLTPEEETAYAQFEERFERICRTAFEHKVRLFVDAEESWYQEAIDRKSVE